MPCTLALYISRQQLAPQVCASWRCNPHADHASRAATTEPRRRSSNGRIVSGAPDELRRFGRPFISFAAGKCSPVG
jgi:hypothetical protein